MIRDDAKVELWNRLESGDIWGLRPDRLALAKESLFGGSGKDVAVIEVENPDYDPGCVATTVYRICGYEHDLWQPKDFMGR